MEPGTTAAAIICRSLSRRHGRFGSSGSGKSFALRRDLDAALSAGGGIALVLDDKGDRAQYDGPQYADLAAFRRRPPAAGEYPAAVFRGAWLGGVVTAEELACEAQRLARAGLKVTLVLDELRRGLSPDGGTFVAPTLQWCFSEGRALGLSVIWSTQSPKRCRAPEPFDEATTLALHRLADRAVNYLADRTDLDDAALERTRTLDVGEFLLVRPGDDWDGRVFRY